MIDFKLSIAYNISKSFGNFRVKDMDPLNIGQLGGGKFPLSLMRKTKVPLHGAMLSGDRLHNR